MENKNFINQSLWAGSSPNQTGETQSRENRIGVFSYFYRTFVLLFMLLTIGVGQMWGWTTYYLKSDNTTWEKSDNRWGFNNDGTTTTYMANGSNMRLWRTDWGDNGWFGVDAGSLADNGNGIRFEQYKGNVSYKGYSGMVCFHMDQATPNNSNNDHPWVWITRPTWYLKHNWNNGSWIWYTLTDNQDGTYMVNGQYGGQTTVNHGDNGSDAGSGWGEITASTVGDPKQGDQCRFTFNSSNKSVTITKLCTITYDANGATSGDKPDDQTDILYNTPTTVRSNRGSLAKTGYIFAGWNTKPDGTGTTYIAGEGSINPTDVTTTLYAKWTKITISATISPSIISANTPTSIRFTITTNAPLSSNYYFQISNWGGKNSETAGGYNIDGDHHITSASPFTHDLADGKTNLDAGTYKIKLKITKNSVLQVESELIPLVVSPSYTVTVNAGAGGIVSPTSISAFPDSWSGDITATPNTGYRFDNWTSSGGGITIHNNRSATTQIKATSTGGTLTANFAAATYRVTLDNQSATTAGTEYVDATYNTTTLTSITKPTKNNYTFGGYYTETGGNGTQIINADGNWLASQSGFTDGSKKSIITENKTLYAHWTEIKYEVTISVSNPSATTGTIDCSAAGWVASNNGTAQIGNATEVSMIAGEPASGYTWGSWVLSGGVTLISGNLTDAKIVVKATSAGTATYTYAEDLSTTWYISGDGDGTGKDLTPGSPFSGWGTNGTRMSKKAGYSTVEKYYCTITVSTVATTDEHFPFQVFDGTNHRGYNGYWITKENNTQTVYTNNSTNMKFRPYITGEYEFEVDNTGANPVLTVHWPSINQLRVSVASPEDGSNIGNFDLTETSTNNWSVTRTLNANTTYTFKMVFDGAWYGNGTAFTRDNNSAEVLGDGNYMTIQTDVAGEYTFTFNSNSKNLSITYPAAYRVTYGVGAEYSSMGGVSTSPSITSGDYVIEGTNITFTATPNLGYKFVGWYSDEACTGDAVSTDASYTIASLSANTTLYAKFDYRPLYIHADFAPNGWATPVQMTQSTKDRAVYTYEIDNVAARTSAQEVDGAWNIGYHFRIMNAADGADQYLAYNYDGVQTPTYTATIVDGVHKTAEKNETIEFGLTKKSYITITLTLQEAAQPTVDIAADPYYDITYTAPSHGTYTIQVGNAAAVSTNTDARATTTITLANTPATGYHLDSWTVAKSEGNVEVSNNQFTMPAENVTVSAAFTANTYSITLNAGTGGSGSGTATIDYDATGYTTWSHTITQTGYHIKGWYDNGAKLKVLNDDGTFAASDVTGYITFGKWSKASDCTLQAWWDPNNYTVTLDVDEDHQGTIAGATTSHTVTFNTVPNTVPNRPTAEQGYGLDGYYTDHNGAGTKVINGDGTFIASVDGYTDENKKWVHDGDVTLYAYYKKAEITELAITPSIAALSATVTVVPTLAPKPDGDKELCWRLLRSNDNEITGVTFSPASSTNAVSFTAPNASGTYKVACILRTGTVCGEGEVLDSVVQSFVVAGEHTVNVHYQDASGRTLSASTEVTGSPLKWSGEITAPTITGYTFTRWEAGDGITISTDRTNAIDGTTTTNPTIYIKAAYDGDLTAIYSKKRMIYFNNTLGWRDVYVYFYENKNYWDDKLGSGSDQNKEFGDPKSKPYGEGLHGQMLPVEEGSKIYYFDAEAAGVNASYTNVVFTEGDQHNYQWFHQTNVVRRGDHKSSLPMFVPLAGQTPVTRNTSANYYDVGYWMNYPENTGYTLKIYNSKTYNTVDELQSIPFEFTADKTLPMSLTVELNANREYGFEIHRADGTTFGNDSKVMKINDSGDNADAWVITSGKRTGVKTSVAGDYIFTLNFGNNGGYNYLVGVHYPVAKYDYRIVYTESGATLWSGHPKPAGWHHPSRSIEKKDGAKDIVSFYVSKADGANASMKFQYASAVDGEGNVTWKDVDGGTIDLSSITQSGVYNFHLKQTNGSISVEKIEPYTGNYYIRTNNAGTTKWDNYRAADHQMTYSEFSMSDANSFGEKYSHYYMHWCPRGTNIKFVIANDYSMCITDTLENDVVSLGNMLNPGWLNSDGSNPDYLDKFSANIRFMYNQETNKISRAYMSSSTNTERKFLVLKSNNEFKNSDGTALSGSGESAVAGNYEAIFKDNEDWIYEREIKLTPEQKFKLYASYAQATVQENGSQHFRGNYADNDWTNSANYVELVGGKNGAPCNARIVYDFKTNRLMSAYVPDNDNPIDRPHAINADIMIVRYHQEAGQQITFTNDGSLTEVKTVYGVMRFNRWILNNRQNPEDMNHDHSINDSEMNKHHPLITDPGSQKSADERGLYWISFPFDVNLSEVFGFGTYGTHWIIMKYNGEERAKQGFWADSEGFWEYIWDRRGVVLEKGKGYVLALELDLMQANDRTFWKNEIQQVELFFPSTTSSIGTIQETDVDINVPEWQCTIDRTNSGGTSPDINKNRTKVDSHWNIIGVPSYANYGTTLTNGGSTITWKDNSALNWTEDLPFLYEWNANDNTYTVQSGTNYPFKAMHSYYVQYHGRLHWSLASATPASVASRTYAEAPRSEEFRLEFLRNDKMEDQTFVKLSDKANVSANFVFGEDMIKEQNATRANIYTIVENYLPVAGNTLPISEQTTVVPVGVKIKTTGDYTFSIPEGTDGIGVTLVDNETGVRTSLSALDYTVNLTAGTHDGRFILEISPIQNTPTDIENVQGDNVQCTKVRKVMIDGILYIVKDGKIFDARGARVE